MMEIFTRPFFDPRRLDQPRLPLLDLPPPALAAQASEQLDDSPPPALADSWDAVGQLSIRVAAPAAEVACGLCGRSIYAAGPIGHAGRLPICDPCLLDHDRQLGMVMAMVAVARAYGSARPRSIDDEVRAKSELLAFARLYDRFAARYAPARPPLEDWPVDG